jgi:membrane associated rhomboid family serine protease
LHFLDAETTAEYHDFLDRSAAVLAAQGAQALLDRSVGMAGPEWSRGWDRIILLEGPGTAKLYAFTSALSAGKEELRARIDRLAAGLTGSGWLTGAPLTFIPIIVFDTPIAPDTRRALLHLVPSTYYRSLRPSTWLADLAARQIYTPGLFGKPAESQLLAGVLDRNGQVIDADGGDVLRQQHGMRMDAFRSLMRGRQPIVTYALIAVNVVIYLVLARVSETPSGSSLVAAGALSPRLIEQGQWWRLVTEMFLHASIPHILFNMTSLFAVGTLAERLYGSPRFLAIYLGSGLVGSLTSFGFAVLTGNTNFVAVGASGAIFGVAGALLTVRFQRSEVIPASLRNRVSSAMVPLVLLSLGFAAITQYVDNSAHIGGLIGGMALSLLFPLTKKLPETR